EEDRRNDPYHGPMRPELCNRNARRYDEPAQRAEIRHEAYQSCRNADQEPMLEPKQGQRCRVEYREDQAQRALADHKAADRVVDLASKSPDGFALRRRYPVVNNRHHLLPIIDEI